MDIGDDPPLLIAGICRNLRHNDYRTAKSTLRHMLPFRRKAVVRRTPTPVTRINLFIRDGFIDRYSGARLVFPATLRAISVLLPDAFPIHVSFKRENTHPCVFDLLPTADHIEPLARGGTNSLDNLVTTSLRRNRQKDQWTLQELGWALHPPGDIADWDGLMGAFLDLLGVYPRLLRNSYLRRWQKNLERFHAK